MNRNALIRALRDTAQSASNAIASNVSGPVDLIAAGLRGVGLPIPQNPAGGSQWMAERGLTAPVQQGVAQVIGDTIGLAGPALVANFAPQIASALNRGAQNLAAGGAPAMRGQMGGVYMGGPRQEALETAQRNAAKPVSEGGLGLPPNNTPMDRARAMGFVDDTYHGTFNRFDNFDMAKANPRSQYMPGVFTADQPELAENFGDYIMPLMQRKGVTIKDVIAARNAGLPKPTVDSIHDAANGVRVTNNPSNLRSRFAAFDPARINENDLLGRADPRLLGLMGLGAAGGLGAYNYMQGQ